MSVVTLWPDLSVSSLDVQNAGFQSDPTWQPTTGSPAGVFPRVLCTGGMGLYAPNTPTNDSFTVYVVGTFAPGYVLEANPDVGGWRLAITDAGQVHAAVWVSAFDLNGIESDATIPDDEPLIISLGFNRTGGQFNFTIGGELVAAHLDNGGAPTASGLSQQACAATYTNSTYDVWIGKSGTNGLGEGTEGGAAINQIKMWDRYHTAPQRAQVVASLTEKWGL
jgi:hypothetical protein